MPPSRIQVKKSYLPSTESPLHPGDTIEIGTSHEMQIDGDRSWISYKVVAKVQPTETAQDTHDRVMEFLMDGVTNAIQRTVAFVQAQNGSETDRRHS